MQKRKLQVFVSSTFKDLKIERQTAVQAILEAGHIPAGMELFIAEDASQWDIIKEWIDESDVYMLIIGGRYGSIESESGKSYTHLEYEYALSVSKPHFVIIIDDETTQNKAKKHGGKITDFFDNSPELKEFKNSIMKGKLVNICENSDKMESSIHKSINKLSQRDNLKGWVKADDTDYASISEQLARLIKENSELKSQLDDRNIEITINNMKISDFVELLKNSTMNEPDSFPYYIDTNAYSPQNSLELFMGIGQENYFSKTSGNNVEFKFLINLSLISPIDGNMTEKGSLLFTYIIQNNIHWTNMIETPKNNAFFGIH
jgi:hypothetical protein